VFNLGHLAQPGRRPIESSSNDVVQIYILSLCLSCDQTYCHSQKPFGSCYCTWFCSDGSLGNTASSLQKLLSGRWWVLGARRRRDALEYWGKDLEKFKAEGYAIDAIIIYNLYDRANKVHESWQDSCLNSGCHLASIELSSLQLASSGGCEQKESGL